MQYLSEDSPRKPEIVAGLFREGQIIAITGSYNIGKSPLLWSLAVHIALGKTWCDRFVQQRPVIHIDFESEESDLRIGYKLISEHSAGSRPPNVPEEIELYLYRGNFKDERSGAEKLLSSLGTTEQAFRFLESRLKEKPNAVIIVDPFEMLIPGFKPNSGPDILNAYKGFRRLFSKFPHSATIFSSNMRKKDRSQENRPDLLVDPHTWLEETSGHLNLINRADTRLGIDRYCRDDDKRIVHGVRRGEEMAPLLLEPIEILVGLDSATKAGFKSIAGTDADLKAVLTDKQLSYFHKLPDEFQFKDHANNGIPKVTLSRIIERATSINRLRKVDSMYFKNALVAVAGTWSLDD